MFKRVFPGLVLLVLLLLVVTGCSSVSEIYSQKNPEWSGKRFDRVMVIGDFINLVYRKNAESELCDAISEVSSTACYRSLDYVFAGDDEASEITEAMNENQIDAMIYVSNLKSGADLVSSPTLMTATSWTTGLISGIAFGGTSSVNWSNYSFKVYTPNGAIIWNGSVNASGDDKDEFIEDSSEEVASKLVESGIIEPLATSNQD